MNTESGGASFARRLGRALCADLLDYAILDGYGTTDFWQDYDDRLPFDARPSKAFMRGFWRQAEQFDRE
jgi:hypothetical protein